MYGIPVDLIEVSEVAAIFKIIGASVRERKRPPLVMLFRLGNGLVDICFKMHDRPLPAAVRQFWMIGSVDQVEHDGARTEIEWYAVPTCRSGWLVSVSRRRRCLILFMPIVVPNAACWSASASHQSPLAAMTDGSRSA